MAAEQSPSSSGFNDVPVTHLYAEDIAYVQSNGIVSGYIDGSFKPDVFINRAEFTKIIVEALFPYVSAHCSLAAFSDTPADAWFTPYVCVAKQQGLVSGYNDGTFHPSDNISFIEAAKILSEAFLHTSGSLASPWYKPYVQALANQNAIPASVFLFNQQITRAEMAVMIHRLKAQITTGDSVSYDELASLSSRTGWKAYVDPLYHFGLLIPYYYTPQISAAEQGIYSRSYRFVTPFQIDVLSAHQSVTYLPRTATGYLHTLSTWSSGSSSYVRKPDIELHGTTAQVWSYTPPAIYGTTAIPFVFETNPGVFIAIEPDASSSNEESDIMLHTFRYIRDASPSVAEQDDLVSAASRYIDQLSGRALPGTDIELSDRARSCMGSSSVSVDNTAARACGLNVSAAMLQGGGYDIVAFSATGTVVRLDGSGLVGRITLIKEDGQWKVDRITESPTQNSSVQWMIPNQ